MTTMAEMMRRLAALEKRVEELEAQPRQNIHYHYPAPPLYVPPQADPHPWWINPITCRTSQANG